MTLSKCCDAEIKFGMVDDRVGHGMHEETECTNCGQLFPEVYDESLAWLMIVSLLRTILKHNILKPKTK